ncbi:MAG: Rne/Rng family ribonuclease, partial [Alphaproteobacteria bacterium]|nr:Rne/Rng family ribonuclease [Alphaproteobacteria bacterium]
EIDGMNVVDADDTGDNNEPIIGFSEPLASGASQAEAQPSDQPTTEETAADPQDQEWAEHQEAEAEQDRKDEAADEDGAVDDAEDETSEQEADDAASENSEIESVAQEDEQEEIRPRRKPRPRRYKIQEVIKVRQILLIQVVKEERGNKGAALTTYLSLAGRYCVLMPNTARGGGISRKITNAPDRKKLKEIANEIEVPEGAGLIIRTAGAKRTRSEIKRDYDYLLRQWEQVRDLTLKSIAPAPIYEEGSLIKRSIRDLYNREIDEILIEGEAGYRMAKDYMKMLMPSHAKNVKLYTDPLPLFARFQVEGYLGGMFNPTVQLRSGGYIVIGVTEALVAIDVNSGRATKEGSIEETATKTNLEAAEEVARQLRLRDLAGLIVIDFIDMEDRRNNLAVEKRIKDRLKTDRARIQVGRISGFGLMEMSRQRLRPGMIEATTAPCPHCHGTGLTRSDDNLSLAILRELEEEGVRRRAREVLVTAPIAISNYLLNQKRDHIAMIESRYGLSVRIEASATLISPDYVVERLKYATRSVPAASAEVVSMETSLIDPPTNMQQTNTQQENTQQSDNQPAPNGEGDEDGAPKKKRRRRRRRGGRGRNGSGEGQANNGEQVNNGEQTETSVAGQPAEAEAPEAQSVDAKPTEVVADRAETTSVPAPAPTDTPEIDEAAKPKKRTTKRASAKKAKAEASDQVEPEQVAASEDQEKPTPKPRARRSRKKADTEAPTDDGATVQASDETKSEEAKKPSAPKRRRAPAKPKAEPVDATPEVEPEVKPEVMVIENAPEKVAASAEPQAAQEAPTLEPALRASEPEAPAKPKRRGWWSRG